MHRPEAGLKALAELDDEDLNGLASQAVLQQARSLQEIPAEALPSTLVERLTRGEARLVEELALPSSPPADPSDCVRAVKRRRYDRERAAVQREIDRLQEQAGERYEEEIVTLWTRKKELLQRIEALDGDGSTVASGSFKKHA
jgi:hypothetical protein